ncbi:vacuolar fusion protein CCZ1 homolog [Malaya genurostris]|uniref:vacuolar fusion protein CCZ1 homolog n=1 Tax=Malaya genurostris TaxID=325434 RepID=UPI0026F3BD00|nr:vacuolar fusion protein CCZ1 homolog [Malaya genurostris]
MSIPIMKAALSLRSFFIFNSNFGPKEGEEEKKILFYHPQETEIDSKVKDVGLCEAIIKFSSTFTNDESVQALHTQKTCQLYYQPEPSYWMVMILNVPFERKTRDTGDYNEYHGDDIHDTIYRAVLKHSYRMFHLFNGTFASNLKAGEDLDAIANLIGQLEEFYGKYILQLKLKDCDVLDALGSVQYLPLNQLLFLRVQNFINMIEATFEPIKHCIFLYDQHIIWSGINPVDLYTIYDHLNGTVLSNSIGQERSRKIHIKEAGLNKTFNFMVCRKVQNITLCLFLEEVENEQALYHELNAVINPQLTSISSDITQHLSQQTCVENGKDDCSSNPKFIYFNELNLHHRGTIRLGHQKKQKSGGTIPNEVMNLVVDLLDDSRKTRSNMAEETILKTHDDFWIVKRSCNSRHVFIVLNKSSTLIDVSEETKRIVDQHLKGIFF